MCRLDWIKGDRRCEDQLGYNNCSKVDRKQLEAAQYSSNRKERVSAREVLHGELGGGSKRS